MKSQELAPVLLFVYKRPGTLNKTLSALQKNYLAPETDLYIFSDAAKTIHDKPLVSQVRAYIKEIEGFKSVTLFEAVQNKGLAKSIIEGVTQVINTFGKVIVLEDDLITSSNFLVYMNKCLDFYERNPKIFSVSGFSFIINGLGNEDIYFTQRASSWGWATWRDRWKVIDWEVKEYGHFRNEVRQRWAFNKMGSDMAGMLDRQVKGKIDSWAIRWCFHQFKLQSFTVYPAISKVRNIGFAEEATNTKDIPSRYDTLLDTSSNVVFNLTNHVQLKTTIIKQFTRHYSISSRLKYKVINTFYNALKR